MNQQAVRTVTRSFSRKSNLGGYENVDFFSSRSYSWFEEPTDGEVLTMSQKLFRECKQEVMREVIAIKEVKHTEVDDVNAEIGK